MHASAYQHAEQLMFGTLKIPELVQQSCPCLCKASILWHSLPEGVQRDFSKAVSIWPRANISTRAKEKLHEIIHVNRYDP